ncbi:MAG: cytochrome c3 family protein [Labilithrix sp.]|nr:cytochrome c3 family protein [Labilithrix sp.]
MAILAAAAVGLPALAIAWARTPYATGQNEPPPQPVKFDHRHHVRDDGIDCLYCHAEAQIAPRAGVPSTATCMGCHAQIWSDSPNLALVRASYFGGEPIVWRRVTTMPDFVFFDHSIHLAKGVGCVTCHGRVDEMAQVYAVAPLTMRWCLDCHRNPTAHLRPLDAITDMEWTAGAAYTPPSDVRPPTDCTTCHR